ncbi:hypothetical protein [Tsukamurella paurometabola]|uniref:Uncharacterized protein n=1 Tax=Tsukamurella paurometabola TaxID=2061 RepID=A0A3P8K6Z3_TSUPA|nr:hypothetical protein [Tsukamurella paurometabola]UEA83962.1 hypothetical protein LK411_03750 [Tsukamurella paurometabola]VDR41119.1 Uncharacterised protein [Tsukamurella paurometabola]
MNYVRPVLRAFLLGVLLVGAVAGAIAAHPEVASSEDFTRALDRGEVVRVVPWEHSSDDTVGAAEWSTGPFRWYTGPLPGTNTYAEFRTLMRDRGVQVETYDDMMINWPFRIPTWFGTAVAIAWVLTFLAMLTSRPRWGNRWAWFWMFTIGQVGAPLYLLLEPRPLWHSFQLAGLRRPEPAPDTTRGTGPREDRRTGGEGCALSLVVGFGAAVAAAGIGWLAGTVLP